MDKKERLLQLSEAAEILNISQKELKELIEKKIIPAYSLGGECLRLYERDLTLFLQKQTAGSKLSIFRRIVNFFSFNDIYILFALIVLGLVVYIIYYIT